MLRSGYFFGRLLAAAIALLAPLIALHGYTLYQQNESAEALAYRSIAERAVDQAKGIEALLQRTRNLLDVLAARPDLVSLDPQRCMDVLRGMSTVDPLYANLIVASADGSLVCAATQPHRIEPGLSFAGLPWFTEAMSSDGPAFGRPFLSPITRAMVSALTVPLRDSAGSRVGLVAATIDLVRLADLQLAQGLPPGGSVTVVDQHDIVISRFPEPDRWIGQPIPRSVQNMRRENPHGVVVVPGAEGVTRAYATVPAGVHGLRVAAGLPTEYVFASPRAARVQGYAVAGITLLLATTLAFLLARALARPLHSLGGTVKAWASGSRGARADIDLPGEFRTLAQEFNAMIDAREASEAQLVESERRYAAMLDGVDLLAINVAFDGRLLYANDALSRLTGWSADELLRGDWTRLVLPAGAADVFAGPRTAAAQEFGVPSRHEGILLMRDGRRRRIRWSNAPLRSACGELIGITSIGEDVTERHDAELAREASARAEAANQAKTEFLAHMSHELRTPLNAVLGFSQLLQMEAGGQLDEVQRHRLDMIRLAGVQLRSLIDDVLDVSQIESGRLAINLETVNLDALIDEVLKLSEPNAEAQGICLETAGPTPAITLRTDPVRLRQVLLNLLSNGVKYNRPGGRVRVAVRAQGDVLEIDVQDDGSGMTPEQMHQLFQPFNRLGRERGPVAGVGIGMTLSRQLVRLLGGDMAVDSTPGVGTSVTVRLKGVVIRSIAPSMPPAKHAAGRDGEPSGTVLYIEDNAANTLIVRELLAHWPDVRLLVAGDGQSGMALARQLAPDLVLLDMRLPDVHGIEVLAALRLDPLTATIPVVSLSASAMPEEVDAARAAGATAYWTKPIDFVPFLKGVSALLAKRSTRLPPR